MAKSIVTWKSQVIGKKIDMDNQSFDCVDIPKSWAEYLYDKPWTQSLSWGNAKDIWFNVSGSYWDRIARGSGSPAIGDIVCMGSGTGGGYGHVAVVIAVTGNTITVVQQDTFSQVAAYTGIYDANASFIQGYLRPKVAFSNGIQAEKLQPYQRKVASVVNYRQGAGKSFPVLTTDTNQSGQWEVGDVLDMKGFVHGEKVEDNDIWFVGMYSGGYMWSGAFEDKGTHDLSDITPAKLKSTQRQIGGDALNWRLLAEIKPENVIKVIEAGKVLDITGYIKGFLVDGNNVWFQYREGNKVGYLWSGGFKDASTHDLSEVKLSNDGSSGTQTYPTATTDPQVTKVYNKKNPIGESYAPTDLVSVGNGQQLRSEASNSLDMMSSAAGAEGVVLTPQSGYRSYSYQKTLYEGYVKNEGQEKADTYSARPGYSEHQTGLALDFSPIDDTFDDTNAYKWLVKNAYKYGWILRYPSDKASTTGYMYEPWHWRYVGITVANDMRNKGVSTLEEYFGIVGGDYTVEKPEEETKDGTKEEKPTEEDKKEDKSAKVEAMKTLGRNGILGALSAVIAAGANWLLNAIAGIDLPNDLIVSIGGLAYAALLALDKYIHENVNIRFRGLIGF